MTMESKPASSPPEKYKGTVLIIDSKDEQVQKVREEVEQLGIRLVVARKLTEATVMMQRQKFCTLLINREVDGSDSHDYILRIRKSLISENQETPIILIGDKFEKDDFEKLGKNINGAVLVPFKEGSLTSNLLKFCNAS